MVGGDFRVNLLRQGCRRFDRLSSEMLDRSLSPRELRFMDGHRGVCPDCRALEASRSLALDLLRSMALDTEVDEAFERRVLRRVKVEMARNRFAYWSPTAFGAAVALALVLATVQLVSRPNELKVNPSPAGEARLDAVSPAIPDLPRLP